MISQLMSGSRLPVGSSAMISRGSWTRARAIAVRCCSPPESWAGICCAWAVSPTSARTRSTAGPDLAPRRAGHLERERHVLPHRLARQELEVLEDDADLAAHLGTCRRGSRARSWPSRTTSPCGRELVADQQLDERGLARPGRPDEEDEVALGDDEVDVAQRDLAVRVLLRDVVQDEDRRAPRTACSVDDAGPDGGWSAPAAVRRRWSRFGSAGEAAGDRSSPVGGGWTPSAGTARGATSSRGYHRRRAPANVTSGHRRPDDGPVRWGPVGAGRGVRTAARAGRARSAGSG